MREDDGAARGVSIDEVGALVARKSACLERLRRSLPSEWPGAIADLLTDAAAVAWHSREPDVFRVIAFEVTFEVETCLHSRGIVSSVVESLFEIACRATEFDKVAIRAGLYRWVRTWLRAFAPRELVDNAQARRASEFIRAHLGEKLTVQTLSRSSGWSAQYLERVFRAVFNISVHEYIVHARIQRAIELLLVGEKVSSVAADVGYRNKTSFNRAFEALTGTTPGRFRRWACEQQMTSGAHRDSTTSLAGATPLADGLDQLRTLFAGMRTQSVLRRATNVD